MIFFYFDPHISINSCGINSNKILEVTVVMLREQGESADSLK